MSFGLGEATLVGYTASYPRSVLTAWSSGTGGAAIVASFSYSILQRMEVKTQFILQYMLIMPVLEAGVFWLVLRHDFDSLPQDHGKVNQNDEAEFVTVKDKIKYLPHLCRYIAPLLIIYFSQYFINQGLVSENYYINFSLKKVQDIHQSCFFKNMIFVRPIKHRILVDNCHHEAVSSSI